jgi:hypothetical protein
LWDQSTIWLNPRSNRGDHSLVAFFSRLINRLVGLASSNSTKQQACREESPPTRSQQKSLKSGYSKAIRS